MTEPILVLTVEYGDLDFNVLTTDDTFIISCKNGNTEVSISVTGENIGIGWLPYSKAKELIEHLNLMYTPFFKGRKEYHYDPSLLSEPMHNLLKELQNAVQEWITEQGINVPVN